MAVSAAAFGLQFWEPRGFARVAQVACHVAAWLLCLQLGLTRLSRVMERYPGIRTLARWAFVASTMTLYAAFAWRVPALLRSGADADVVLAFLRSVPMLAVSGTLLGIAGCQTSMLTRPAVLWLYTYIAVNVSAALMAGRLAVWGTHAKVGWAAQFVCGTVLLVVTRRGESAPDPEFAVDHTSVVYLLSQYIGLLTGCISRPRAAAPEAGESQ